MADSCEHGMEISDSLKGGKFNKVSDYWVLINNSTPWS
jgi:hypothetical protein